MNSGFCVSPGYAHAIACFCYRDHIVGFGDELKPSDCSRLFSIDRLIRTEISTLIGLMIRAPRDLALPQPNKLKAYIFRTEALLKELHEAMEEPVTAELWAAPTGSGHGQKYRSIGECSRNAGTDFLWRRVKPMCRLRQDQNSI